MDFILSILAENSSLLNGFFALTIFLMCGLFLLSILAPYSKVTTVLPLTIMFNPKKNLDLDLQSVGYALLHSTWWAQISHYTIFIDAFFWFVLLACIHWSLAAAALAVMIYQALRIGEKWFSISFIALGTTFFVLSLLTVNSLNTAVAFESLSTSPAWLVAVSVLLLGGLIRFSGHIFEPAPPMMLDDSDKFVKILPKTVNWKLILMPIYGFVAEFASGLPYRLFIVQVNYLYQKITNIKPTKTQSWTRINERADKAFKGGYKTDEQLANYYHTVMKD